MSDATTLELGPLAPLLGIWEGEKGRDVAPSDDRGTEINLFRERITFEATGKVENHEQTLYGLRYAKKAWRIGEPDHFHEELGYWLWDAKTNQVICSFMIPRGVAVMAGGTVEPNAKSFVVKATVGSETYGICSNKFLDVEFKTVAVTLKITIAGRELIYEENTELRIKGQSAIFNHTDTNILKHLD